MVKREGGRVVKKRESAFQCEKREPVGGKEGVKFPSACEKRVDGH